MWQSQTLESLPNLSYYNVSKVEVNWNTILGYTKESEIRIFGTDDQIQKILENSKSPCKIRVYDICFKVQI